MTIPVSHVMTQSERTASRPVPLHQIVRLVCLIAYPILVLAGAWLDKPGIRVLALPVLGLALFGSWLNQFRGWLAMALILCITLLALWWPELALWPPSLICLTLAGWFALSLLPGRQPLIESFARAVHDARGEPLPAGSGVWLRAWTVVWVLVMTGLGAAAAGLAMIDSAGLWLLFAAFVMPIVVLFTLGLEFVLRLRRFPDYPHLSLPQFFQAVGRLRPEQLLR